MNAFETMRAMIALGLTDEQKSVLLDAMEKDAKPKDATAAERQQRRRDKLKAERDASRVTSRRDDPTPPNEYISNPPCSPVEAKASTAPRGRSDRGSKISEDWTAPDLAELTPEARALAEKWPAAVYRAEAEAFRNYWLGESSGKARKSNWNRAWCNRIVAVSSRVMRDQRFAPQAVAPPRKAGGDPKTAAECEIQAEFWEGQGKPDEARRLRERAAALRKPSGTQGVGNLVSRMIPQSARTG